MSESTAVHPVAQLPVYQTSNPITEPVQTTQQEQRTSSFIPASRGEEQPKINANPPNEPITVNMFDQKINQAIELKNSGNAYFKQKNYVEAIREYSGALKVMDPSYFYGATQAEMQKMAELSATLMCNMGFCYFNSHDMHRADLFFTEAIVINPKYIKALHKRALARFELKKYQEAFADIKEAFNLDKSNAEIHSAYSKILEKYNEETRKAKQQMKEMSSKIFSNQSQKSINSPRKQPRTQGQALSKSTANEQKKGGLWSWPSVVTLAGAATVIGFGLYKALRH